MGGRYKGGIRRSCLVVLYIRGEPRGIAVRNDEPASCPGQHPCAGDRYSHRPDCFFEHPAAPRRRAHNTRAPHRDEPHMRAHCRPGLRLPGEQVATRVPTPHRLRSWYEYITGVVARDRIVHLYDDLNSGRLPHRPGAEFPRFRPILHGTSTDEQQRVLGVLGRRYHADFRAALRDALRNKNSFIRAQAAAVASRLDAEEKNKLWSSASPAGTPDAP